MAALLANFLWPMLLLEKLGYQCSPGNPVDPVQVCAGGLSYLLPLLSLGIASAVVGVLSVLSFRLTRTRPLAIRWFAASGSLPVLILIYALTLTRSLGDPATLSALVFSIVGASACVLAATLRGLPSKVCLGCAVIASAVGIIAEPGASTIFLLTGSTALVGIFTPAVPTHSSPA